MRPIKYRIVNCLGALMFLVLLSACFSQAKDDYYEGVSRSLGTSMSLPSLKMVSPFVDSENRAGKLTNRFHALHGMLKNGEIAGIRLGMTMGEVVARWGKPPLVCNLRSIQYTDRSFYDICACARRSMVYTDCALYFESNCISKITISPKTSFDRGLTGESSSEEWLRIMGEPTFKPKPSPLKTFIYAGTGRLPIALELQFSKESGGTISYSPHLYLFPESTNNLISIFKRAAQQEPLPAATDSVPSAAESRRPLRPALNFEPQSTAVRDHRAP